MGRWLKIDKNTEKPTQDYDNVGYEAEAMTIYNYLCNFIIKLILKVKYFNAIFPKIKITIHSFCMLLLILALHHVQK